MNTKVIQLVPRQVTPRIVQLAKSAKVVQIPVRQMLLRRAA
jgi:hypothetical protein